MSTDERGALPDPGEGLSRQDAAKKGRGDAARPIIPRQGAEGEQLSLLHIAAPAAPLPAGTFDGADAVFATDTWSSAGFTAALEHLAASGREITADSVRAIAGDPASAQLLGAVFAHAARRGIIRPLHVQASPRRERRGGLRRVWVATDEYLGSIQRPEAS